MMISVKKADSYDKALVCPPDKSISIRAVILSSYAVGVSVIENLSLCDDVMTAVNCMRQLGASVKLDGSTAYITGTGGRFKSGELDCGNSATTARLLLGLLAGTDGMFVLRGDSSLSRRPMKRVITPLETMGADIRDSDGHMPISVIGKKLTVGNIYMDVPSAQVKSAIILAGLCASGITNIYECESTRNHTEIMLKHMGADLTVDGKHISVCGGGLKAANIKVPGDISSAAYPICLALSVPNGKCTIENVGLNSTRTELLKILKNSGANITVTDFKDESEPFGKITVVNDCELDLKMPNSMFSSIIDEIPVLCALAAHVGRITTVPMPAELKFKESDRSVATARMLERLGAVVDFYGDSIAIDGRKQLKFGTVDPDGDHRIAMSAAVAMAAGNGGNIVGGECVSVSYPEFFEEVIGE